MFYNSKAANPFIVMVHTQLMQIENVSNQLLVKENQSPHEKPPPNSESMVTFSHDSS